MSAVAFALLLAGGVVLTLALHAFARACDRFDHLLDVLDRQETT